jgi:prophage antirepressor-like protein
MELINQIDETINFNENTIRVIGTYTDPWFVAKDICKILELSNITEAVKNIPINWRSSFEMNTFGGVQEMITINEAALYKLIMRSRKPIAQPFQNYVCEVILPTLRKTGEYKIKELVDKNKELENAKLILDEKLKDTTEHLTEIKEKHFKLEENHKRILYKKTRHTLKKGPCLYLIIKDDVKFGVTKNLNARRSSYVTYFEPDFKFIMYTNDNLLLEKCVKRKYRQNITNTDLGTEWIIDVDIEIIISSIEELAKCLNIEYTIYKNIEDVYESDEADVKEDEETDVIEDTESNGTEESKENHFKEDTESNGEEIVKIKLKTCSSCLLAKEYTTGFNKDKTKKDGYHTTCKVCEKETKLKYKARKQEEFVPLKDKKCAICEEVKDIINFSKHIYTKDGYVNSCLQCSQKITNKARLEDKNVRYKCGNCDKDYARKDTLTKHQKNCITPVEEILNM